MKYKSLLESVGKTPVLNITSLYLTKLKNQNIEIWIKLEKNNPGGSIKDRIALSMIEAAEREGKLKPNYVIIEPTSGNTGVGLSLISAIKGYKVILTMPESMSIERRKLMQAYGAEIVLTPRALGMKGAIEKAKELLLTHPNAWMPMQFENLRNPQIHYETTAQEIINDFPTGPTHLVCGVGTGGHLTGCSQFLKEHFPGMKTYAVEPIESQVLAGKGPGPHFIQGIGAGFIPPILNRSLIDQVIAVSKEKAFSFSILAAQKAGLLVGISTGASLAALDELLPGITQPAQILLFAYDTGERYLSVEGLF